MFVLTYSKYKSGLSRESTGDEGRVEEIGAGGVRKCFYRAAGFRTGR